MSSSSIEDLQIPFEEIASATDNFAEKNLIYKGSSVNVYKGKLLGSGPLGNIVVQWKIEHPEHQQGWKHVIDACRLRRKPSVVGFCGDKDIIVYDHIGNGSLKKDASDATLSWMQRLQTCIELVREVMGLASKNVFIPWSAFHSKNQITDMLELPFFSPDFEKIYMVCLGDLMYEVLCEKKSEQHPAILAIEHYENGDLEKIVHPHLLLRMHQLSFIAFSEIAYGLIYSEYAYSLDSACEDLQTAFKIQRDFEYHLDRSKIELKDLMSSTNNFAKEYIIGSETYSIVYKAELNHFDRELEMVRRKTVAIKCISKKEDVQDDRRFFAELSMLLSCQHSNIVSYLGFCHEGSQRILVYKYAQNLDEYLRNTRNNFILTWAQRIQICLDIAHGLNYIHESMIIHGNIKSANILLGDEWNAMIADFGFSVYYNLDCKRITTNRKIMPSTSEYLDPEYERTGEMNLKSDIYSFGVILFEILSGRLANDSLYFLENDKGLAPIARRRFNEGTINEMVDPNIKKEVDELNNILYYGAIHDSLDTFSKIAYQCLAETPDERPTLEEIIKELQNASNLQGKLEPFKIQLSTITKSTNNFSQEHWIGSGTYGTVYKAELDYFDRKSLLVQRGIVAIKHVRESEDGTGDQGFSKELSMLGRCEHPNIISLLGFCDENSMKILVYEYAFKKSLAQHLESIDGKSILTWTQRIRICLGIANGLNYLHNNTEGKPRIIHRDIKSDNILLDKKWNAKIADFGLSKFHPSGQERSVIKTNNIAGTSVYLDPEYKRTGQLRRESDIYSFGVVLFEVLSGRLAYDEMYLDENGNGIAPIVRQHYNEGRLKDMVDPRMKEASDDGPNQDSLDIFSEIAYRCLDKSHAGRPMIEEIIKELQSALNSQEMEHCSTQGRGSHSTRGQVSSTTKGIHSDSGVKTGDQHFNCNEDTLTFTQAKLDDIPASPETRHDVEGVEGVQGLMVQELRDKIENMEQHQKKLEAQLEAERTKNEKMELYQKELKAQLEAERARNEKMMELHQKELKAQLEAERARTAELEEMIADMKASKCSVKTV